MQEVIFPSSSNNQVRRDKSIRSKGEHGGRQMQEVIGRQMQEVIFTEVIFTEVIFTSSSNNQVIRDKSIRSKGDHGGRQIQEVIFTSSSNSSTGFFLSYQCSCYHVSQRRESIIFCKNTKKMYVCKILAYLDDMKYQNESNSMDRDRWIDRSLTKV